VGRARTATTLVVSGGRLPATALDVLDQRNGRYGVVAMCEGEGMANVTVLERL
jgi:acetyl-CoA acyltransferase